MASKKRFCLALIKPSHYDEDGYVFQWWRSPVPSNSLAVLYGLALDCEQRKVLGDDVRIETHPIDETHTRVRSEQIAKIIEEARSVSEWVALYPRYYFVLRRVMRDPNRLDYLDEAITPVTENDAEKMEMFQSEEAQRYLVNIQRVEKLKRGAAA